MLIDLFFNLLAILGIIVLCGAITLCVVLIITLLICFVQGCKKHTTERDDENE